MSSWVLGDVSGADKLFIGAAEFIPHTRPGIVYILIGKRPGACTENWINIFNNSSSGGCFSNFIPYNLS